MNRGFENLAQLISDGFAWTRWSARVDERAEQVDRALQTKDQQIARLQTRIAKLELDKLTGKG